MIAGASQIGLFALAESKFAWIDARQHVLAQNIANADTPGYQAKDVMAFSDLVGARTVAPVRTNPLHLAGLTEQVGANATIIDERSPDGNAVKLEDQMTKVADDETTQAMVGNIWHSYMGMFMTALGHGG